MLKVEQEYADSNIEHHSFTKEELVVAKDLSLLYLQQRVNSIRKSYHQPKHDRILTTKPIPLKATQYLQCTIAADFAESSSSVVSAFNIQQILTSAKLEFVITSTTDFHEKYNC